MKITSSYGKVKSTYKKGFSTLIIIFAVLIAIAAGVIFLKLTGKLKLPNQNTKTPSFENLFWNNSAKNSSQVNLNLPQCQGKEQLNTSPVDLYSDSNIIPLGNLNPVAGHVTPTDHIYINLHDFRGSISNYNGSLFTLKSPGDITLVEIQKSEHALFGKVTKDFRLAFAPCQDLILFFDHVRTISPLVQSILDKASSPTQCNSNQQGDTGQKMCKYMVSSPLKSGDEIGQVAVGFDFGGYDLRTPKLSFINQDRTVGGPNQYFHTICPLDYFSPESLRQSLYQKVKNTAKNSLGLPDCGSSMQDKQGTIQGNWYKASSQFKNGIQPFSEELAIVHSNTNPSLGAISIGGNITQAGITEFTPQHNGTTNREPSKVTSDGIIYCYEDTQFPKSTKIILQLINDQTLKIEPQPGTCSAPLNFNNPSTYTR